MKRLPLTAIFFALLLSNLSFAKNQLNKAAFVFEGHSRSYYSYVPDDPAPMPVVVLLHGSGRDGREMAGPWQPLAELQHFILVAPNSLDSAQWDSQHDSPAFLHEVVNQVKTTHPVDPSRIYLFGHSGGAVYALAMALVDSEYFAATAAHAGALRSERHDLFRYAKRHMPVAIWVGDHDALFPEQMVHATQADFEANGFDAQVFVLPHHTHSYDEVAAALNPKVWSFFATRGCPQPAPTSALKDVSLAG